MRYSSMPGLPFCFLILLGCLPAKAECPSFEVMEARQSRLETRIAEGLQNGQLSEKQAAHLRKLLASVAKREAQCRAGKNMSQWEANRLDEELDSLSRSISRALKSGRMSYSPPQGKTRIKSESISTGADESKPAAGQK